MRGFMAAAASVSFNLEKVQAVLALRQFQDHSPQKNDLELYELFAQATAEVRVILSRIDEPDRQDTIERRLLNAERLISEAEEQSLKECQTRGYDLSRPEDQEMSFSAILKEEGIAENSKGPDAKKVCIKIFTQRDPQLTSVTYGPRATVKTIRRLIEGKFPHLPIECQAIIVAPGRSLENYVSMASLGGVSDMAIIIK
jgi:hypothetical protein